MTLAKKAPKKYAKIGNPVVTISIDAQQLASMRLELNGMVVIGGEFGFLTMVAASLLNIVHFAEQNFEDGIFCWHYQW